MTNETRDEAMDELIAGDADLYDVQRGAMTPEQCVMVCPQCEGEGTYGDGTDEAACSTICTRCESNGWIVDVHSYEYASARIKGDKDRAAQSSAPNEIERLTKCLAKANAGFEEYERRYLLGCDDIERLTAALDTERTRADKAEQRERELREGITAVLEAWETAKGNDLFYRLCALIQPEPDPLVERRADTSGYIVGNGDRTKWRAWQNGWSTWVDDPVMATRYYFRTDAMAAHQEDEDAWCIVPFAEVSIVKGES